MVMEKNEMPSMTPFPRVLKVLGDGCNLVANNAKLMVLPFVLDLVLLFGPRLRIAEFFGPMFENAYSQMIVSVSNNAAAQLEMAETLLLELLDKINLLGMIQIFPIGVNLLDASGSAATPFEERVAQASKMRTTDPKTFATKQDYDHEALRTLTDGIVNYVNRDPVNSTVRSFDFNTTTFTFTDDRPGARIDPDDLYNQVAGLLDDGVTQKELRIVPEKILAEVTKTELMNRFGLISAYTTTTTNDNKRNTNIQLSAQAINGKTVLPGEIFSFNGATGERTAAKGYQEAPAISGGQSKDEVGGGVCQTSSTLFNAVARADLEIIERNPHAWPSHYIEKGFDATVNWPGLDFKFKNNTEWPIFIVAGYNKKKVTVNIYGMSLGSDVRIDLESELVRTIPQPEGTNYVINTELSPGESKKTVKGRKGYEVKTWKVWYQGNREIKREVLFTTTYKAYQETIEYNPR